ncbi:MAG TPA: RNA-binding S4 domain-containing protein [Armatimonadota bacterium]|jgi:ribosomal 50S subunit-recycling heat shock protein
MRVDLFLRNSGIIPRRTQAQKACDGGLIKINGKSAKPSSPVEVGQELLVQLGMSRKVYRVLQLPNRPVAKAARTEYAELLESSALD